MHRIYWTKYAVFIAALTACNSAQAQDKEPDSRWPLSPLLAAQDDVAKQQFQGFVRSPDLPRKVNPNYYFEELSSQLGHGWIARAKIFAFAPPAEDWSVAITLNRMDSNISYWSYAQQDAKPALTAPLINFQGNQIAFRHGRALPEQGDSSGIVIWNLAKRSIGYLNPAKDAAPLFYPVLQWSQGGRFLSYIRGGNSFGEADKWSPPQRLFIYDTKNSVEHEVALSPSLDWSWTYHGTLLFTPHSDKQSFPVAQGVGSTIYEVAASGGVPQPLIRGVYGGYDAQASPDNQWIAFCANQPAPSTGAKVSDAPSSTSQRGLFLFHRPTKRRVFVGELSLANPPLLQWSPDGQTLWVLDPVLQTGTPAVLFRMELQQQQLQKVAVLGGEKPPAFFKLRGIAPQGNTLYVEEVRVTGQKDGLVPTERTFFAVDAKSGVATPFARLNNSSGDEEWDWHDDSGPNLAYQNAEKLENALPVFPAPKPLNSPTKASAVPQKRSSKGKAAAKTSRER